MRNAVAYFFGLIRRVLAGEFRLWASRKTEPPTQHLPQPTVATSTASPATAGRHAEPRPKPTPRPTSCEIARAHLANMRKTLGLPARAGDAIAHGMPAQGWHPA
ncbi:MAG: hypothetical protein LBE81_07305 [Azonexus sp.]|nr:hypothetical protein [Azonexus sp.]